MVEQAQRKLDSTIPISKLKDQVAKSRDDKKYIIAWDMNGHAKTYFQHMEILN